MRWHTLGYNAIVMGGTMASYRARTPRVFRWGCVVDSTLPIPCRLLPSQGPAPPKITGVQLLALPELDDVDRQNARKRHTRGDGFRRNRFAREGWLAAPTK